MPDEDRRAFEKFTAEIRQSCHPEGPLEQQVAQSIAEDEWRLNRARSIENNIVALGHSSTAADVETDNSQIHAAMTQARTFWRNPEKFALLTMYEQRISRKIQRSEERLRALQTERKAALHQVLEEARLLAARNGFAFSTSTATAASTKPVPASVRPQTRVGPKEKRPEQTAPPLPR